MKRVLRYLFAVLIGAVLVVFAQKISTIFGEFRTIQILDTSDKRHSAVLKRLYCYIDVNFVVFLDGKRVYRSNDFAPYRDQAFREQIAWDKEQKHLVFSVADQFLFACNLQTGEPLRESQFSSLVIPKSTLETLGYEHPK